MITRLNHVTYYVLDQDVALTFYRDKLGFEVRTDHTMDNGFRWLTVGPKTQPDLEIVLMAVKENPMMSAEKVALIKKCLEAGILGAGVLNTDDCRKTFAELKAKGVHFKQEPTDRFYGVEAVLQDPFGNWFSLSEAKK